MPDATDHLLLFPAERPDPLFWLVNRVADRAGGCMTAVTRVWGPDVAYCGRCPRELCSLTEGVCLVCVQEYVPTDRCDDLSTLGRPLDLTLAPDLGGRVGGGGGDAADPADSRGDLRRLRLAGHQ